MLEYFDNALNDEMECDSDQICESVRDSDTIIISRLYLFVDAFFIFCCFILYTESMFQPTHT
jgi:hypothetical protein